MKTGSPAIAWNTFSAMQGPAKAILDVLARPCDYEPAFDEKSDRIMSVFFDFEIRGLDGRDNLLESFRSKAILAVNLASECGFTPQYEGLEALYRELGSQGLTVVGFPCNQFGAQEPGTAEEILNFCSTRFNVTFPLSEKIEVNGDDRHPLYAWLTSPESGYPGNIEWNFEKFLINRDGSIVGRYPSATTPSDNGLLQNIADAL